MLTNLIWYVITPRKVTNFQTILILYRCQLLGVARGLTYLHQYDLVHGNLTGVSLIPPVARLRN